MTQSPTAADLFTDIADAFTEVVDATPDWSAATPCTEWTARDLLAHIIETEREALVRFGLDAGPAVDLTDPPTAWAAHRAHVRDLLADEEVANRPIDSHFGPSTIGEQIAGFYGFDLLAHRWDLSRANGTDTVLSDSELGHLEHWMDVFGDAMYAPGICAPAVDVAPDSDRQTRVLGRLGRTA